MKNTHYYYGKCGIYLKFGPALSGRKGKTFDIELRIHPNFEFSQQILKYGSLVKVIEPKWLAEEIREELRKGFESY